jgi:hypothetical protein
MSHDRGTQRTVADQAAKRAVSYADRRLEVYDIESSQPRRLFEMSVDFEIADIAFLPSAFTPSFVLAKRSSELVLWRELVDPDSLDATIRNCAPFTSCLQVCLYPPDLLFGYIGSNGTVLYVYELLLVPEIGARPIRRLRNKDFVWFDFADGETIAVISKVGTDFRLSRHSPKRLTKTGSDIAASGLAFVGAAVSPADAERVAVLLGDANDCALVICRASEQVRPQYRRAAVVKVQWSPFGSEIEIVHDEDQVDRLIEVSPGHWQVRGDRE